MKPAAKKSARKSAQKKERGNLKPTEVRPLAIAAKKAYEFQEQLGNIAPGQTFNDWRHEQCMEAVQKPGITACSHDHYRPLMAHFQILAGRDEKAYQNLTTTGQASNQNGDTHEKRRKLAHQIIDKLSAHIALSDTPWLEYLSKWEAAAAADWIIQVPGEPFPGLDTSETNKAFHRKDAITKNDGPIREGYLVYLVRKKTRRPDLHLGRDLKSAIADRCTVNQLTEIRNTIMNRISAKEGLGSSNKRNKTQSRGSAKASRSHKTIE